MKENIVQKLTSKDDKYVWHDGRFIDRWADDWILEKLELCFAHYEESDIRNGELSRIYVKKIKDAD